MAYPSLTFANLLENATRAELEQLISLLQGYLSQQHDETGAHTDVTATTVTTTGAGTFGGNVIAQSASTTAKTRMGDVLDVNAGLAGTGLTSGLHIGGAKGWVLATRLASSPGTTTDYELRLFDLNHLVSGISTLRLFYYTANSWWTLGVESGGTLALGEDASGKRLTEVNTILARASTGYYERGRTAAIGEWTPVSFSAGNYTASGAMTWTVAAGDVFAHQYMLIGKTMFLDVVINTSTVTAPLSTDLQIAIPGGFTAATYFQTPTILVDNLVSAPALAVVAPSGTYVSVIRADAANLSASADQTYVRVSMCFEVA